MDTTMCNSGEEPSIIWWISMKSICSIMLYRSNQLEFTPGKEDMISPRIPISLHSQTFHIFVHIPVTTCNHSLLLLSLPTTLQEEIIRVLRPQEQLLCSNLSQCFGQSRAVSAWHICAGTDPFETLECLGWKYHPFCGGPAPNPRSKSLLREHKIAP